MKIHFLGTGASEGVPALFCECEHCREARISGGKNYRTRTGAQIDEDMLIDFSMDCYAQVLFRGLDLSEINHLLITHSHEDHFNPTEILRIRPPMAFYDRERILNLYGNPTVMSKLQAAVGLFDNTKIPVNDFIHEHELQPFDRFQVGKYQVMALPATHDKKEFCYIYAIRDGEKTLLYGHDSAYFSEETWEKLKQFHFDCVVLDCTMGEKTGIFEGHMGLPDNVRVRERMLKENMATESTVFIATHFAHTFNPSHDRITPVFAQKGFIAAYDGMKIEF